MPDKVSLPPGECFRQWCALPSAGPAFQKFEALVYAAMLATDQRNGDTVVFIRIKPNPIGTADIEVGSAHPLPKVN